MKYKPVPWAKTSNINMESRHLVYLNHVLGGNSSAFVLRKAKLVKQKILIIPLMNC